ncbi:hypothetical protein psal_cds_722 [Pandoravirus salinus]|uniref:Uncharacterized protein n=1 Tax=Pandoravirus salinus TaxID=1349410 RepID=S4VWF6_9VIRU|nr:hypothetical protein psal_cds_722 [Pandoravirus salinus]AGO84698.2 hypothetical protein psal_cds_722 [Pandoravirus salinus]
MNVLVSVCARPAGPVLLEVDLPVDGLCRGSRYFAAMLGGGFRESIVDHPNQQQRQHPKTTVVLPLPQCAPWGLEAVLAHVAGVADEPRLGAVLAYWHTLNYLGADARLQQCADALNSMADVRPSYYPVCFCTAYGRECIAKAHEQIAMLDPEVLLSAYAITVSGVVAHMDVPDHKGWSLRNPASVLFDRDRLWSLCDGDPDKIEFCDECGAYIFHDRHAWVADQVQRHGGYRTALLAACDQSLSRLRTALTKSPTCAADWLDMCVDGNPALLSLASMTALRDWHRVIAAASPHTSTPYALSLCDLFDPACVARLIVRCNVETRGHVHPDTDGTDTEHDTCLTDKRQAKRRRSADAYMTVTVDSQATFEAALREAFPRAADAVLACVCAHAAADDTTDDGGGHPIRSGAVLAGGCVVEAVQQEPLRARLPDSDMDLWIVGEDSRARKDAFRRIVQTLFRVLPDHRVTMRGSVVTFALPDDAANREAVQVIYTDARCGGDVVSAFDLSHAAAYYDGQTVWATWDCMWSLVSRSTDVIPAGSGLIRPVRIDRALRKGFQPTEALVAMTAVAGDHTTTTTKAIENRQDAVVIKEYADADAMLAAFTYRPIDARDYDKHLSLPKYRRAVVEDPVYLSMPPLYMPFEALCRGCTQSRHGRGAHDRECTCKLALRVRLDLPRFAGDDVGLSTSKCLTGRAAAFRQQIKDTERVIRDTLKGGPLHRDIPSDEIWEFVWDSVAKSNDSDQTHPGLLRMQCLGTTTVVDALTGQTVDLKGARGVWLDGRVVFRHVDKCGGTIMPLMAAADLRVYPRSLYAIVNGLDVACLD